MKAAESREIWRELSTVEDWLSGGLARSRVEPDFDALEKKAEELKAIQAALTARTAGGEQKMSGQKGPQQRRAGMADAGAAAPAVGSAADGPAAGGTGIAGIAGLRRGIPGMPAAPAGHGTASPSAAAADIRPLQAQPRARLLKAGDVLKPGENPASALTRLESEVSSCDKCGLCAARRKAVFGMGPALPLVLVVGEGPGAEEDATGRPFVGPAGRLLDKMLGAIGLERGKNAYIANVVKCRPPNNRTPLPDECAACLPYLEAQIALLGPKYILCMGRTALQVLTGSSEGIMKLRGRWFDFGGIPLIATYHPSALLRDENLKRPAWEDLKELRSRFE